MNEVTFDLGDGETVTASGGGSEAEPAARHVYETKGTYAVTVTARWVADLVARRPGAAEPADADRHGRPALDGRLPGAGGAGLLVGR